MRDEDTLLIARTTQAIQELESDYAKSDFSLEAEVKKYKHDIHLEILTCEMIIDECKKDVLQSSIEDIVASLNLVYHMHLQEDEPSSSLIKLDQVTNKFLSSKEENKEVNEDLLEAYRLDMKLIRGIVDALQLRIKQLDKEKKYLIIPQVFLISQYEKYIKILNDLETKMMKNFSYMSDMITNYIIDGFHYIYLYYSYLIKYFLHSNKQIILVEVASSIDRIIKIMKPVKEECSLKNENLRNFYVIYELNALKKEIMEHYK